MSFDRQKAKFENISAGFFTFKECGGVSEEIASSCSCCLYRSYIFYTFKNIYEIFVHLQRKMHLGIDQKIANLETYKIC